MFGQFNLLSDDDKVAFFLHCQSLLALYHPTSKFAFRDDNIVERLQYVENIFTKYKGFCFTDNNVAILYNKVKVTEEDLKNPAKVMRDNLYKESPIDFNTVNFDFVVMKNLRNCFPFIKSHYDPKVINVIYVRDGKPTVYKTSELIKGLGIPSV